MGLHLGTLGYSPTKGLKSVGEWILITIPLRLRMNIFSENKKKGGTLILNILISTYQLGHPNIFPLFCHEKKPTRPSFSSKWWLLPRVRVHGGRQGHGQWRGPDVDTEGSEGWSQDQPKCFLSCAGAWWNAEKCWKGCCEKTVCSFFLLQMWCQFFLVILL